MRNVFRHTLLVIFLLGSSTLACALPGVNGTPTPPPSPTPEGDTLTFRAPYTAVLDPGTRIPGTRIVYVQSVDDLHELSIDGLQAYRRVGDSLAWRGVVAPGVFGDYRLRLRSDFLGRLQAEGQVDVTILNPTPVEIPPTQSPVAAIHFEGIPVNYFVPEAHRIPGTTLVYEGIQSDLAELSGTAAYPFFARDDSLLWLGKVRDNVHIRYNLRVEDLNEQGLSLSGTAQLWATP